MNFPARDFPRTNTMLRFLAILPFLATLPFLFGLLLLVSPATALNTQSEDRIFTLSTNIKSLHGLHIAPDGNQAAVRYKTVDGKWMVQINETRFGPYTSFADEGPAVSLPRLAATQENAGADRGEDTVHAHLFWYRHQYMYYVVTGNKTLGPFESVEDLRLNRDGTKYSFRYRNRRHWFIRNTASSLGPFPVKRSTPFFAHTRQRIFPLRGQWYVLDSGRRRGPFPFISALVSPDYGFSSPSAAAEHYAEAQKQESIITFFSNSRYYFRFRGQLLGPFTETAALRFAGPDKIPVFWARTASGNWSARRADRQKAAIAGPEAGDSANQWAAEGELCPPVLSLNGKNMALRYRQGTNWFVVSANQKTRKHYGPFPESDNDEFAPVSQPVPKNGEAQAAFWFHDPKNGTKKGSWFLKLPGEKLGPFRSPSPLLPRFSPQGEAAYTIPRRQKTLLIVGKQQFGPYEAVLDSGYSRNRQEWWAIRREKTGHYIRIGDQDWGPCTAISRPLFAEKGSMFLFSCQQNEKRFVQSSEQRLGPFLDATWTAFNEEKCTVAFVSLDKKKLGLIRMGTRRFLNR